MKPDWLLQAARPGGPILPQKCRADEQPAALKPKKRAQGLQASPRSFILFLF